MDTAVRRAARPATSSHGSVDERTPPIATVASGRRAFRSSAGGDGHGQRAAGGHERGGKHRAQHRNRPQDHRRASQGHRWLGCLGQAPTELAGQHHSVEDGNAGDGDEPDPRGNGQREVAGGERRDATDGCQRSAAEHRYDVPQAADHDEEHAADDRPSDGDLYANSGTGAGAVLELAAPGEVNPLRQGQGGHLLLRLVDEGDEVPPANVHLHQHPSLQRLSVEVGVVGVAPKESDAAQRTPRR
jgi:hypothetical protein